MDSIFHGFSRIDDDFYEELEETLIMGDLGVRATMDIIEDLKEKVKELAPENEINISGQYNNYENMTKNVPF